MVNRIKQRREIGKRTYLKENDGDNGGSTVQLMEKVFPAADIGQVYSQTVPFEDNS
jgi:hypothetical protein